jgi:ATP-dependent Clp protease ATP-binding subunit ClpC
MFERYTEKARRVIFFARYEASQFGQPYIETEHLLLGLLREDKALTHRFLRGHAKVESIRNQIEDKTLVREKVATSVDLPLSNEGKRVLAHAAEEAERMRDRHIGTEHLLLGLLREEKSFAAELLRERGVSLEQVRQSLHEVSAGSEPVSIIEAFTIDLTLRASENALDPLIGRGAELDRLIQVLGRSTKRNAVLVGETGVGRHSIINGLAYRVAQGSAPGFLHERPVLALDLSRLMAARRIPEPFIRAVSEGLTGAHRTIFVMDDLVSMLASGALTERPEISEVIRVALLEGKAQCISIAMPEEIARAKERNPWLTRCFTEIPITEPDEQDSVTILTAVKGKLEKFHSVAYSEDVIRAAVRYTKAVIKDRFLPDKALDLLDEAASYVKAHNTTVPPEITELQERYRFITRRTQLAIANHEFEKAKFYVEEERQQRENLRDALKKHKIDEAAVWTVSVEALEQVLAGWTGISVEEIRRLGKASEG